MAAGRSLSKNNHHNKADKRWNNYGGTTKHLVKIDGETILERTVRLIHQFESDEHDVYIIARSSNYHVPNSKLFLIPENDDIFSLCGRFLQIKDLCTTNCVFVYGDVWYSENAMGKISAFNGNDDMQWFGRTHPSKYTGKGHGESFGIYIGVNKLNDFFNSISSILTEYEKKVNSGCVLNWFDVTFGPTNWTIYCKLNNSIEPLWDKIGKNHINFTEIDDFTDDFDNPSELEIWKVKKFKHGKF